MNTSQLTALLADTYSRLAKLSGTKGEEYTQGQEERLSNFLDGADRTGVTPMQYLFIAMDKHYNAVANYVKDEAKGRVREVSEPIDGRLLDLILYSVLARALSAQVRGEKIPGLLSPVPAATTGPVEPPQGIPPRSNLTPDDAGPRFISRPMIGTRPKYSDPRVVEEDVSDSLASLQHLVRDWAQRTFPSRSLDTVRLKLLTQELPELSTALGLKQWDKVEEEIADAMILILDLAEMKGFDIATAVRKKMEINRSRNWTTGADGISQHI